MAKAGLTLATTRVERGSRHVIRLLRKQRGESDEGNTQAAENQASPGGGNACRHGGCHV
jgi:hypothetical protein